MNGPDTELRPRDAADLAEVLVSHPRPVEPIGGGSKRAVGRPAASDPLILTALAGVVDYSADELVLTAGAATPLADITSLLSAENQRLAFEPPDLGALLGTDARPTLGGVIAANLSGSRRVSAGAARDHFLGFDAVSGRGERFRAGGRVVKNVTGYDLPKLLAGSWGTLAVLTEVTVRVAPTPPTERTLIVGDSKPETAVATMAAALGSAFDVSAAAFDPWQGTLLRLEGFPASVSAREQGLAALVAGPIENVVADRESRTLWRRLGSAEPFADWPVVWRLSVPPSQAPAVLEAIAPERYVLDWGGGLIWLGCDAVDAARVRGSIRDGHAMLVKAPAARRARTCVRQPPSAAAAALAERIKQAFDPDGRLNPGRMD